MSWTTLLPLDSLVEGEGKYVAAGGHQLAVFLHQGRPHVMDNRCPHAGGSLAGGSIQDGQVVCPWHYWAFRLDTGAMSDTDRVRVPVFATRIVEENGRRWVQADLPEPQPNPYERM